MLPFFSVLFPPVCFLLHSSNFGGARGACVCVCMYVWSSLSLCLVALPQRGRVWLRLRVPPFSYPRCAAVRRPARHVTPQRATPSVRHSPLPAVPAAVAATTAARLQERPWRPLRVSDGPLLPCRPVPYPPPRALPSCQRRCSPPPRQRGRALPRPRAPRPRTAGPPPPAPPRLYTVGAAWTVSAIAAAVPPSPPLRTKAPRPPHLTHSPPLSRAVCA